MCPLGKAGPLYPAPLTCSLGTGVLSKDKIMTEGWTDVTAQSNTASVNGFGIFHREPYSGGASNVSRCFGPCHRNWRCPRVGAEGWKPHRPPGSLGAPHPPGDAAGKEHLLGFPSVLFLIQLICFSLCCHVKFINENDTSSYNRYRDHQFRAAPGLGFALTHSFI